MEGRVHSFQSMGTLDGPGVRCVVFLQGCPLRCICCHNPDTWDPDGGSVQTVPAVMERVLRYRSYFGREGGLTVSGGEPLYQPEFVAELFEACRAAGIHTCLDTSGYRLDRAAERVLDVTDLVLLDLKMTTEEEYRRYTGISLQGPLRFLEELERRRIPTWLRQVVIPGIQDNDGNLQRLAKLSDRSCVQRVELLAFRKLCLEKYHQAGIPFLLETVPETSEAAIRDLTVRLNEYRENVNHK